MRNRFYLDTSIWLDLLENRNEINWPKGDLAQKMLNKMRLQTQIIFFSDIILIEFSLLGYDTAEIKSRLNKLYHFLIFVEATEKQFKKSKDLSKKRKVPIYDALHAIITRDNHAVLISHDNHFKKLNDIVKTISTSDYV